MSQSAQIDARPVSITEFDAFLDAQRDESLWELVAGEIVAMTNPTERHEQIVANIGTPLKRAMDPLGCRVYFGGVRVQRSADSRGQDKPRPDLLVRCGVVSDRPYVTDPLVVVEVLSPSTIDTDRGGKLAFYKRLPTLRHALLVYQEQMRVEHYRRTDRGWELEELKRPQDLVALDAVRFELALSSVYFGVPGIAA